LALGAIAGLAVLALVDIALQNVAKAGFFAVPTTLAVLLTTLAATFIASAAERVSDAGRRVSQTAITGGLLLLAAVLYFALTALASVLATGVFPGVIG
jgi:hypothetical protein